MCDAPIAPMNIQVKMLSNPSCPSPCRQASRVSCRRASNSSSQRSVRSNNSGLAVPSCMKASRKPSKCCNEPRPDCCNIPCCAAPLPKCPQGVYVERVQPIRPDRRYEPPTFPFEGMSSYREQYHLKCGERAKSFKPNSQFDPSEARMDGLSTYREAYTQKPLVGYQKPPWAKKAQFEPSGAKMEGYSTYRFDYKGCMAERVQSIKPNTHPFDPSTAKMEGITTYRFNYIPYCSREYDYAKQPLAKRSVNPGFSCAPMEGVSTYRTDYWPKCCAKRRSLKPNSKASFSDAKFADRTTYRNDYNPFHFEKCVGQCIPAEVYDELYPACGNFVCGFEKDPPRREDAGDNCPPMPSYCPPKGGCCGNEMGLFPGQPLPECCQLDPAPADDGDC